MVCDLSIIIPALFLMFWLYCVDGLVIHTVTDHIKIATWLNCLYDVAFENGKVSIIFLHCCISPTHTATKMVFTKKRRKDHIANRTMLAKLCIVEKLNQKKNGGQTDIFLMLSKFRSIN